MFVMVVPLWRALILRDGPPDKLIYKSVRFRTIGGSMRRISLTILACTAFTAVEEYHVPGQIEHR